MTDQLFFDTDCISAFLWVKEENILFKALSKQGGVAKTGVSGTIESKHPPHKNVEFMTCV